MVCQYMFLAKVQYTPKACGAPKLWWGVGDDNRTNPSKALLGLTPNRADEGFKYCLKHEKTRLKGEGLYGIKWKVIW